jgi:hypothetical protein
VGGIYTAILYSDKKQPKVRQMNAEILYKGTALNEVDTDGDGLKDWEEILWKTDPRNPDTDGDGTNDGNEIMQGRDPLTAGPNDHLKNNATYSQYYDTESDAPISPTDQFARTVFTKYINLKQSGAPLTADLQDALAKELIKDLPTKILDYKTYTMADVRVVRDESLQSLHNYGNRLGAVLIRHYFSHKEDEIDILYRSLQTEDDKELAKIAAISKSYHSIVKEFAAMDVPYSASYLHTLLINAFNDLAYTLEEMQLAYKDPMSTLAAMTTYKNNINSLSYALININVYFFQRKVTFTQYDNGYALAHGI